MGKWIAVVILTFLCLPGEIVSAREDEEFFNNLLFEEVVDEAQCEQSQMEVSVMDSAMSVDKIPKLAGKWLSQECEVRPGPEFVLRSYSFVKDNSFRLILHHYDDESCVFPLYSVIARGSMIFKQSSWVTPSGADFEYSLTRVTIIPHTTDASEKLSKEEQSKCLRESKKSWKPHREYVIFNNFDDASGAYKSRRKHGRYRRRKIQKNIDCLSAMGVNFNELMLIRTQWRKIQRDKTNRELLLGDIHSRRDFSYKPTAFQVPLLHSEHAHECVSCQLIAKATELAPPHLLPKAQLPPLPHGQWVSRRCEVRPLGMFLTRRLSFDSRDRAWMAEYKFHADPFCTEPAFAISATGTYQLGPIHHKEKFVKRRRTGTNIDLLVEEASLTLYDPTLRDSFNVETNCGVGPWYLGIAKDLSPTSGCPLLGITLPSTEYDLIKSEIDNKGTPLLLLGLQDTENKKRGPHERPTSYQAPLAQCSVFPQQNNFNNQLEPISYARIGVRSSGCGRSSCVFLYILLLSFLYIVSP